MIIYVTDIVIIPMKLNIFTCTKVVRRSKAGGPKWGSMIDSEYSSKLLTNTESGRIEH